LEPEGSILGIFYCQWFDSTDPKLKALRTILKKEAIKWSERVEHVYSDTELRSFPLLALSVGGLAIGEGYSTSSYGTTYDLSSACPRCGTGAVQTSPLMIPLKGLPKKNLACCGPDAQLLVAEPLVDALREARVTGLELRQARFYQNQELLPWWQMISHYELPKMSPQTRGVITDEVDHVFEEGPVKVIHAMPPCPVCRQDGRYGTPHEPMEIAYNRSDVDPTSLPDVVHTWERAGPSSMTKDDPARRYFAPDWMLVKPKIFDIFRELKVKKTCFDPVRFID
jgi:hypothetical protein